ncbi:Uncharacterized protein TCM_009570 [Theobroma cacao]|uniref:Uncharacterized protein n=1 Tax=Theobroma cacao TaxID=3641 RepID=A0A061E529_THECC|nr:Uncharacterized protein TCM_009570 [Theobroma cacao]
MFFIIITIITQSFRSVVFKFIFFFIVIFIFISFHVIFFIFISLHVIVFILNQEINLFIITTC